MVSYTQEAVGIGLGYIFQEYDAAGTPSAPCTGTFLYNEGAVVALGVYHNGTFNRRRTSYFLAVEFYYLNFYCFLAIVIKRNTRNIDSSAYRGSQRRRKSYFGIGRSLVANGGTYGERLDVGKTHIPECELYVACLACAYIRGERSGSDVGKQLRQALAGDYHTGRERTYLVAGNVPFGGAALGIGHAVDQIGRRGRSIICRDIVAAAGSCERVAYINSFCFVKNIGCVESESAFGIGFGAKTAGSFYFGFAVEIRCNEICYVAHIVHHAC